MAASQYPSRPVGPALPGSPATPAAPWGPLSPGLPSRATPSMPAGPVVEEEEKGFFPPVHESPRGAEAVCTGACVCVCASGTELRSRVFWMKSIIIPVL